MIKGIKKNIFIFNFQQINKNITKFLTKRVVIWFFCVLLHFQKMSKNEENISTITQKKSK